MRCAPVCAARADTGPWRRSVGQGTPRCLVGGGVVTLLSSLLHQGAPRGLSGGHLQCRCRPHGAAL